MTELRFDPDKAHKAQKSMFNALIEMNNGVERRLRNVALPEMPATVAGSVRQGIAHAVAIMADARVVAANVASVLKGKAQDLGVYDKAAELSKWWTAGDIAISVTGADAFYKSFGGLDVTDPNWNPLEGKFGGWQDTNYSKSEQAAAWASFGLNFVGGPVVKGVYRGGRWVVNGVRGGRAAKEARVAAQLARLSRYDGVTMPVDKAAMKRLEQIANTNAQGLHTTAMGRAELSTFGVRPGGTHLYSGGAGSAAQSVAGRTGSSTIEMVGSGRTFDSLRLYDVLPSTTANGTQHHLADTVWGTLSTRFASQATGPVRASTGGTVRPNSVFVQQEIPALLKNPRVPALTVSRTTSNASRPEVVMRISRSDPAAVQKMLSAINGGKSIRFTFVP